jgi:hypothetical protein
MAKIDLAWNVKRNGRLLVNPGKPWYGPDEDFINLLGSIVSLV